jgi:hypothetical protein
MARDICAAERTLPIARVRQRTPNKNRCSVELLGLGLRRENGSDWAGHTRGSDVMVL